MAKLIIGVNDLETVNPNLAKEWHPVKNGVLTPGNIAANSKEVVFWLLPYDDPNSGKHFDFEWAASVLNRNKRQSSCPFLRGAAVWKGFNDFATVHPELVAEWDFSKNSFCPWEVTACSSKKVHWIKYYWDSSAKRVFRFTWEDSISHRHQGRGCPYLSGQKVFVGFNDLQTKNPELAAQWNYSKNNGLKPTDVTANSNLKVWWICAEDGHEWVAAICDRNRGDGCPLCSNRVVAQGYNDLATTHPDFASQWHPTKNGELTPEQVTAHSSKKVWWICEKGHEWCAVIFDRIRKNTGCPKCCESKGEKAVSKVLTDIGLSFKEEHTFSDRFWSDGSRPLRDDFAIFNADGRVVGTIEYHGRQHYEVVDFGGKGPDVAHKEFEMTLARDSAKTAYLKSRGIPQLIIPYTQFNNIEDLVLSFVDSLKINLSAA